jgi:hypothetical protein
VLKVIIKKFSDIDIAIENGAKEAITNIRY